ncbi:MAG: hypothetical protein V4685_05670 [Bacteroidota bacterium]
MQNYLSQLLSDITYSTNNVSLPFTEKELQSQDWISDDEENKTAPVKNLQVWTGITQVMLPPNEMLDDEQVNVLLEALKKMLDAYNCCFVLQIQVPERIQYETIRNNINQQAKVKRWHMGFFEVCAAGTEHRQCSLGEYCECAFFKELFADMIDEELTPEEERARMLEIEVQHIKRKYDDEWMKYYPYHLDKEYDDENGNPYNYGFEDEKDDDDTWWR